MLRVSVFLIFWFTSCVAWAQIPSFGFENVKWSNLWHRSGNPAAIAYQPYKQLAKTDFTKDDGRGSFCSVTAPAKQSYYKVNTEGYFTRNDTLFFWGRFSYKTGKDRQQNWNNTSLVSPENPYIIADSIGSNYDNEQYRLEGKVSSLINEKIRWAAAIDYKVGSKSDQKDPRPRIQSIRVRFTPGIIVQASRWKYGLNGYFEKFNEVVGILVVDRGEKYRYFGFKGLGNFQGFTDDNHERVYKGRKMGAGLSMSGQLNKELRWIGEVSFNHNYERSQEGATLTKYLTGDFTAIDFGTTQRVQWISEQRTKDLLLSVSNKNVEGLWFDQKQQTRDDGGLSWEVFNSAVNYKKKILHADLSYHYVITKEEEPTLRLGGKLSYTDTQSDYFPERFFQAYKNVILSVNAAKFWKKSKLNIALSGEIGARKNLTKSAFFGNILFRERLSIPEFEFQTAEYVFYGATLELGFPQLAREMLPYLKLSAGGITVTESLSAYRKGANRLSGRLQIGFMF